MKYAGKLESRDSRLCWARKGWRPDQWESGSRAAGPVVELMLGECREREGGETGPGAGRGAGPSKSGRGPGNFVSTTASSSLLGLGPRSRISRTEKLEVLGILIDNSLIQGC